MMSPKQFFKVVILVSNQTELGKILEVLVFVLVLVLENLCTYPALQSNMNAKFY